MEDVGVQLVYSSNTGFCRLLDVNLTNVNGNEENGENEDIEIVD